MIFIVLSSIQFDGKVSFMTVEIEDEAVNGMLSTELEPETAASQQQPEQILCIRLMKPERSSEVQNIFGELWLHRSRHLPHPGPLPEGEGEFVQDDVNVDKLTGSP
jgi:hypothetical protein